MKQPSVEGLTVVGLKQKPFIGQVDLASSFSRRISVLAACVGLVLAAPIACVAGEGEGIMDGFGKSIVQYITTQVIEYSASAGLNQINNVAPGYGAGTLMSVLGGNTTDEQLANITSQITVAQGMITSLQKNLVNFENQNYNMLQGIANQIDWQNYNGAMKQVDADYILLQNAVYNYTNAVGHCYSNGVLKTQLSPPDQSLVSTFLSSSYGEYGNQDLSTFATTVLTDIQQATNPDRSGNTAYDYGMTVFREQVPFEHQTYTNMYNLFNYITGMRATALFLMKEYNSYQWSTNVPATNTLVQWMTNNSDFFTGPQSITQVAHQIDNDVANNSTLLKMATLLSTSSDTNRTQPLAYLQGLINTNYLFAGPSNQPVYQVINNTIGEQRNYLITLGGLISFTSIPVYKTINLNGAGSELMEITNTYSVANYAQHTADGRFQLAGTNDLSSLLPPGMIPLPYLVEKGGLANINNNTTYIYLNSPAVTNTSSHWEGYKVISNSINGKPEDVSISQPAVLINVQAAVPNYVTGTNVLAANSNSLFMSIYYDTHLATGTNQYFHTALWSDLPQLSSLDSGDVLDLTRQKGAQTNTTVRICGNATILGGLPGTAPISGLTIETYGGNLTLSNLCLTATNGLPVINNVSGPLTVVVLGSNSLATTVGPAVVSASGANITFTGPGSLQVSTGDTTPAVQATGDIIATGATNLTFSSQGSSSLAATRIFISNSTVSSQVGVESDDEFAAGTIVLGNSVLDMSYGIISPYIISPCTWLGQVRGKSQFTVQSTDDWPSPDDMFPDGIFMKLVGRTGTNEFMNINSPPEYNLGASIKAQGGADFGTATFNMSYSIASTGTGDFPGLGTLQSIQIYKENDWKWTWKFVSADIAPNVRGDVASTYHVAGSNFWFNTTATNSFSAVEDMVFRYTVDSNNTVTITGCTGTNGAVVIPSSIHGHKVTSIAANAFKGEPCLGSVTIPTSVTNLGASAFYDCPGLTGVYFQGTPPNLGANVFSNVNATIHYLPGTTGWTATYGGLATALWEPFTCTTNSGNATVTLTRYTGLGGAVIIPNLINGLPVTGIAANAFQTNTALTSITIPASVTSIPDQAFENCYCLTAVYFQGSAPSLGANVFTGADLATAYYLPVPGTTGWGATYGGLPTALWEPFTSTTNSDNATATLTGYTGPGGTVTIPGTLNGLPVTSIGTNAFTSNVFVSALQITNVLIPNTVTNLGDGAFQMCSNLVGVYFQGNAPSLGANVFTGDAMATAYRLPATTGWGAMFGVLPTAPWLTVNGGADGGDYSNLQQVTITANNPTPTNGLMAPLVQWTGTTQYVANVNSANTTVAMPAQPVTLTAMFEVAPVITAQPASLAAISGGNATFNVTAWGPVPLAYQWYFNNSSISGATAASQTLTGVTTNNVGSYTVVVTNLYGSVTSSVAALTVDVPPSISTQPASQVAAVGGTVNLSASAAGTAPFAYQWFKNGGMVLGATNSALTYASAGVTNSGVYYVVVTNAYGLTISLPATMTVGAPQLLAWGNNGDGQLGDGTMTERLLPEPVANNVVAAAVGGDQSLYLKSDGTLWTVGFNGDGELGDGTTNSRSLAESVASNVVAAAAGQNHSLYLKSDGTLWAVGYNSNGQLGDGTTTSRSNAVSVASNVVAAAAGAGHSLYLKSDGTLWAMGYNGNGQLGDGTMTSRSLAESVASNVVAVAAGAQHSLYLKSDGTLWAMGYNGDGELGDGTTIGRSHAVAVGVGSNVAAVAAGDHHSLFAKADGTLWAMGRNDAGQLGDGTTTSRSNAVSVASNVAAVAAGGLHSLYLKSDGALWAMGRNNSGQLGDGTVTPWNGQVQVSGMALASVVSGRGAQHTLAVGVPLPPVITSQPASQTVLAGSNVTFTVAASGFAPLVCQWYFNGNPRGGGTNFSLPGVSPVNSGNYTVVVSNAGGSVTSSVAVLTVGISPSITTQPANHVVAAGGTVNLHVSTPGTSPLGFQWFKNGGMILGATNNALSLANASVMNSGVYYVVLTNAYGFSISRPASVTVGTPQLLASGYNSYGQLGDGTTTDKHLPESVVSNVVAAAAGNQHTLYLESGGTLWAVGYNSNGQLGIGNTTNQHATVFVTNNVVAVAAGSVHSLFVTADGSLYAMGWNGYGQLGIGNTADQYTPVFVTNNVVAVAAGHYHSLYIRTDGTLWAMGYNSNGQLGIGNTTDQHAPVVVTNNVVAMAAGSVHSLFVTANGTLWAMGNNSNGQLGDGTTTQRNSPVSVTTNVVAVAAGYSHSLYISAAGTLWAMGDNNDGQLGDGTTISRSNAVSIAGNVIAVAAGYYHSLYISVDGTLWAMGNNGNGQLGDGTTTQRKSPVSVPGMSLATVVSGLNANHTLAIGMSLPPNDNRISCQLLSAGDMRLSFAGVPGWNYALDRSFSLLPTDWVPQATNSAGAGGVLVFTNTPDPTTNNFWRIRSVP